jgi:hypothetical protein
VIARRKAIALKEAAEAAAKETADATKHRVLLATANYTAGLKCSAEHITPELTAAYNYLPNDAELQCRYCGCLWVMWVALNVRELLATKAWREPTKEVGFDQFSVCLSRGCIGLLTDKNSKRGEARKTRVAEQTATKAAAAQMTELARTTERNNNQHRIRREKLCWCGENLGSRKMMECERCKHWIPDKKVLRA